MNWFGAPWPSYICYDGPGGSLALREDMRVERPVGSRCVQCETPIDVLDRGVIMGRAIVSRTALDRGELDAARLQRDAMHAECLVHSTSCRGCDQTRPPREAARRVWADLVGFCCPLCGRRSVNHDDIRHGYCGACHEFFPDVALPDFGQDNGNCAPSA